MEEGKDLAEIETISLEELREGSNLFKSSGMSYLKVTKNGLAQRLAIPIKSTGVTELVEEMNKSAPIPPIINIVVRPEDPAYKELKLTRKQHIRTFDYTDQAYLDAKEKFQADVGIQIVLQGIGLKITDKDGNDVTDTQRKVDILKGMGLTGEHFGQLIKDITYLSRWEEEKREDFLSD